MKVVIKFMGDLGHDLPGIDDSGKVVLDLPEGARVTDILKYFNIPVDKGCVVIINNKISKHTDILTDDMVVTLLQEVYGG